MTDNIIHFKTAKKKKSYAEKEKLARENRIKFGRSKQEKLQDRFEKAKQKKQVEDHRLDKKTDE